MNIEENLEFQDFYKKSKIHEESDEDPEENKINQKKLLILEYKKSEEEKKIDKSHSKWLVFPVSETEKLTWQDFSAKTRVAHSTKKNLLIAIVDEEESISYYEIVWTKIR